MKNIMKIALTTALLLSAFAFFDTKNITVEATSNVIYKTTASLNMRSNAGTSYKVINNVAKNTQITVTSSKKVGSTTWYKTTVNKKTGWVSGGYLVKVVPVQKDITVEATSNVLYKTNASLNMRSDAGTSYKVITTVAKNTHITVTSSKKVGSTTWYKTTINKKTGWVSGGYLVKVVPIQKDKFNLTTGKFFTNIYAIKNPSNTSVLANKNNQLSSSFVPSGLRNVNVTKKSASSTRMVGTAATALESMFTAAKKSGVNLGAFSGYRSYNDQKSAYEKYKDDKISARPGHSEHQTGLVMDIVASTNVSKDGSKVLIPEFGKTKEGKWLENNAHNYGFILRYPLGKEKITGYSYEPWHVRYVGKDISAHLYKKKWTLEEAYINGYLK